MFNHQRPFIPPNRMLEDFAVEGGLFDRAMYLNRFRGAIGWVKKRDRRLTSLIDSRPYLNHQHHEGTRTVEIALIVGTLERTNDFDIDFLPCKNYLRERWVRIARKVMNAETLPPVQLIRVDNVYFVVDGHHRVSVARFLEQDYVDADVTVWEYSE